MNKNDQACEYLKARAAKLGANVSVYAVAGVGGRVKHFTMMRKGAYPTDRRVEVSLEDPADIFAAKVRHLMG